MTYVTPSSGPPALVVSVVRAFMMTFWHNTTTLFGEALNGMAQPWVICMALVLTTLLLEDLAIAAGVAGATQGALSWEWAFAAVAGGIAAGDLGLYGLVWQPIAYRCCAASTLTAAAGACVNNCSSACSAPSCWRERSPACAW